MQLGLRAVNLGAWDSAHLLKTLGKSLNFPAPFFICESVKQDRYTQFTLEDCCEEQPR